MRKYNLPIFIPHRGCPFDCAFCNQRKITGVETDITPDYVKGFIDEFLKTINRDNSSVEVAFFGGSFTGMALSVQEDFLKVAAEFGAVIDGIRLSTRPDYISSDIIELLKKYNVTTVELGVQSSDNGVLQSNNRGHSFEDVIKATGMLKAAGINVGHQMMLGMYSSNPEKDMKTVADIIALKPSCVRIYPVVTLKGTALEKFYNDGIYVPYSTMQAAELAKKAVCEFRKNSIDVIRVGLHSSDELDSPGTVVAGPYHQAFGELVESLIYRDMIEDVVLEKGLKDCELEFKCPKGEISKAVGHKKMNTEYFLKKYNLKLKVKEG